MKYGDTDQPAGIPVTTPDGSRRNLQEHGDGVSRLSARTKNFYPQTNVLCEPPWYGTVCPVVWEDGGSNPASYPIHKKRQLSLFVGSRRTAID